VRRRRPPTVQEALDARAAGRDALRRRNADRMHRVAARLPACPLPLGQCPLHKHEAPGMAIPGASTDHDSWAEEARWLLLPR
jgi:hypothetical protein